MKTNRKELDFMHDIIKQCLQFADKNNVDRDEFVDRLISMLSAIADICTFRYYDAYEKEDDSYAE